MKSRHLGVFICGHIFRDERPVLLVIHETDGDWQLLCGGDHDVGETPHVVGVGHLLDRDPSLQELADLPLGWEAERESADASWQRTAQPSAGGNAAAPRASA